LNFNIFLIFFSIIWVVEIVLCRHKYFLVNRGKAFFILAMILVLLKWRIFRNSWSFNHTVSIWIIEKLILIILIKIVHLTTKFIGRQLIYMKPWFYLAIFIKFQHRICINQIHIVFIIVLHLAYGQITCVVDYMGVYLRII
jgi:hypothetical protein